MQARRKDWRNQIPPSSALHPRLSDTLHDPCITLWESFNRPPAIIIQLESAQGVRKLEAILTECGHQIDPCFIGTLDVRASMGFGGPWGDEPEFLDTVQLFYSVIRLSSTLSREQAMLLHLQR